MGMYERERVWIATEGSPWPRGEVIGFFSSEEAADSMLRYRMALLQSVHGEHFENAKEFFPFVVPVEVDAWERNLRVWVTVNQGLKETHAGLNKADLEGNVRNLRLGAYDRGGGRVTFTAVGTTKMEARLAARAGMEDLLRKREKLQERFQPLMDDVGG